MSQWIPQRTVTEVALADAIAALEGARPERVRRVDHGWDNVVFEVDDHWYFRVAVRALADSGLRLERRVLPKLAALLPTRIPHPCRGADGPPQSPWPMMGYRPVPGTELARALVHTPVSTAIAASLGTALSALHSSETLALVGGDLGGDRFRRADLGYRITQTLAKLDESELPRSTDRAALGAHLSASRRFVGQAVPERVTHGDLHVRHVIVQGEHLSGVIDWGDLHRGDPAMDLELYWSAFDAPARAAFEAAYGAVSARDSAVAVVVAIYTSIGLLLSARDQGVGWLEACAADCLRRIAAVEPGGSPTHSPRS